MKYAKIENDTIVDQTNNIRLTFPNTSFPRTLPDEHEGWKKIVDVKAIPEGQAVESVTLMLVDGIPTNVYTYRDKNIEELTQDWEEEMKALDREHFPRYIEDLIDALPVEIKSVLGSQIMDGYNAKQTKRSEKP